MELFNSLGNTVQKFTPHKDHIKIYSCGPTVYDHLHIGNLKSFIFADTLRRTLIKVFPQHKIRHIMNITDVDDKTIKRSLKEFPDNTNKEALKKLTTKYTEIFLNDTERIGNDISPDSITFSLATESENIEQMKKLISQLKAKGFAYISDDGVYFSIDKYKKVGKKYGQLVPITVKNTAESRINNDEYDKDSAHDFVLWKLQKNDEPAWEFELDGKRLDGRPGWHIECSAMSERLLGLPIDIHTGGVDLKFPHHENEIAQSTALKKDFSYAGFFVHNEHTLVDDKKMSKSLGNFFTLDDVINRGFEPLALRLLYLQSHYRSQTNFTWDSLEAAQIRLGAYRAMAVRRFQPNEEGQIGIKDDDIEKFSKKILAALKDDLNTPEAIAALNEFEGFVGGYGISHAAITTFEGLLKLLDALLGLNLSKTEDITPEQKELIAARTSARKDNDWQKADELRDKLEKQGIEINDTPFGPVWSRV